VPLLQRGAGGGWRCGVTVAELEAAEAAETEERSWTKVERKQWCTAIAYRIVEKTWVLPAKREATVRRLVKLEPKRLEYLARFWGVPLPGVAT